MSSLTIRRIIVWVVSMALGFILSAGFIMLVLPWMGPNAGNPISIQKYGMLYFITTAVPIGLIFVVWLDHFMNTRILPD
jgi:hypothetical protein